MQLPGGSIYLVPMGPSLIGGNIQPEDEQSRIIRKIKLAPYTPKTITSKQKLLEELRTVRNQEYALDNREIEEDVECIGAPVRNHIGDVIAALSISGPQKKIHTPQEKDFISEVVKAAASISAKLGYAEAK